MQFARLAVLAGCSVLAFAQASASSSPLDTTIDLLAPATHCSGSNCPSDINLPILSALPLGSSSFTYASSSGTSPINYLATIGLDNANSATYPVVCDEISGTNIGPTGPNGFTATYSNAGSGGGALGFGAGGTNLVDLSSLSYSNSSGQPGVSLKSSAIRLPSR